MVTRRPLLFGRTAGDIAMIELHGLQKAIGQQTVIDLPVLRVEAGRNRRAGRLGYARVRVNLV